MGGGATRIGGLEVTSTSILHGLEAPEAWKPCRLHGLEASGLLGCILTTYLSTSWPWEAIVRRV